MPDILQNVCRVQPGRQPGYELWGANSAAQYYALNTPNASNNHNNSLRYGQPTPVHSTNGRTLLLWWIAREEKCMSTSMV